MTETQPKPLFRLGTAAGVAEAVPYLLGYQPREKVVVIGVRANRHIGMTMAVHLDQVAGEDLEEMCNVVLNHLLQDQSVRCILVQYSDADDVRFITHLQVAAEASGIDVADLIAVRGGQVASLLDLNPPQPIPFTEISALSAGVVGPVGEREDLIAALQPATVTPLQRMEQVRALQAIAERLRISAQLPIFDELVTWLRASEPQVTADVRWAGALRDVVLRDLVMAELLEPSTRQGMVDRLAWLAATAPEPFHVAPATLWGIASWLNGNGAAATQAIELALAGDRSYSLARLMDKVFELGVAPKELAQMIETSVAETRAAL